MATEIFANQPSTTVSSGGTTAPSSGTTESWTVAASSSFPAAATGLTQFHVADVATGAQSEIIAVTNVSGTTWSVTRGAESTIPVAHTAGFTITQVVSAGALGSFAQAYPVMSYGATGNGTTDDTTAIQAAITAASSGGDVYFPYTTAGYLCGALTIPPGVRLMFARGAYLTAPAALAAPWIVATASVVHNGTAVIGGTFDATAVTSAACLYVMNFGSVTSCPNIRIDGNRIINAPKHGILVSEATYTYGRKWVTNNSVEQHGTAGVGFGIYADFVGNVDINGNYVTNTFGYDCIELGHSGSTWLTINAFLTCRGNVVKANGSSGSSGIQFPFSNQAIITGNTVIGGTIQNDANTANNVTIADNTVIGATPAGGYGGIRVFGAEPVITGNKVFVTTGQGIATSATMTGAVISDNYVFSSAVSNTGSAIYDGGSGGSNNVISGNVLDGTSGGGFTYGLNISSSDTEVYGNVVTSGCFDGTTGSGTVSNLVFHDNIFNIFNVALGAAAVGASFRNNPGLNPGSVSKTSTYSVATYDFCVLANATSAAFTVTLPTAVGVAGQQYVIKKTDSSANAVTVATTSAQTIDGAATVTLASQWQSLYVVSDGSNWDTCATVGGITLDTTPTDIKNLGTALAAGSTGKAADAGHVHSTPAWLPSDTGLLAWNYDPALGQGATTHLGAAGLLYAIAIPVRQSMSVTNIVVYLSANGGTLTSGQCFAALYPGAGGTLIGQTADQSTAWGAGAVKEIIMPLAGGPFTVSPGIVYAGFWYNGTTGPAFLDASSNSAIVNPGTLTRYGSTGSGITTTAPGTLGGLTQNIAGFWAGLS